MNKSQNDMNFHSGAAESPGQRAPPKATPGKKPGVTPGQKSQQLPALWPATPSYKPAQLKQPSS